MRSSNNKNYLKIVYPLDLPENLTPIQKTTWNCNIVEALGELNRALRLAEIEAILYTDYHISDNYTLMDKRYHEDCLLLFVQDKKSIEILSRGYFSLAANIKALADYVDCTRYKKQSWKKHKLAYRENKTITVTSKMNDEVKNQSTHESDIINGKTIE